MICFENEGLIDLVAVRTFGVNAKDDARSENPIGFFGTGLKYAIAVALRNGVRIRIHRGTDVHEFTAQTRIVRGQRFELVCLDDEELGFTTHVGANWEAWQAFRELYCNALDEGGRAFNGQPNPREGVTIVAVAGWPDFEQAYADRDRIVLTGEPWKSLEDVEVHRGATASVYYRGIRAGDLEFPATFTYNVLSQMTLTEDRTLKHPFIVANRIRDAVVRSRDREFIEAWLTAPMKNLEHQLSLNGPHAPSDVFLDVATELLSDAGRVVNPTARELVRQWRDGIDFYEPTEIGDEERAVLDQAISLCRTIGHDPSEYRITVVDSLGDGRILAKALRDEERILLARRVLMRGMRYLMSTLLEEYLHLRHGLDDESRELQDYLFDLVGWLAEEREQRSTDT